ncbi:MAG: hypothetical protein ACE5OZ_21555 [Candidatus Heimdallarchaeota archaeon]
MAEDYAIIYAIATSALVIIVLYVLSEVLLRIARNFAPANELEGSALKQDLYQGGETIQGVKRRYMPAVFQWASYFSILHVIAFILATAFILALAAEPEDFFPWMAAYAVIALFTVLTMTRATAEPDYQSPPE